MRLSMMTKLMILTSSMLLFSCVVAEAPASRDDSDHGSTPNHLPLISFGFMLCSGQALPQNVAVTTHLHVDTEVISVHLNNALVSQALVSSFASFLMSVPDAVAELNNSGVGKTILVDDYDGVWNDGHFTRYRYVFRSEHSRDWDNKLASIEVYVEADTSEDDRRYLTGLFSSLEECSGGSGVFYRAAAPVLLAPFQPTLPNRETDESQN